ncbi:hypothetical protein J4V87_23135 [Escherichia coli]
MKMIFTGKFSGEKTVLAAGARHTVKEQAGEREGAKKQYWQPEPVIQ